MEKKGLKRPVDATPNQFSQIVAENFPDQGEGIREAAQLYEAITYGKPSSEQEVSLLRRLKTAIGRI
jgi:hypothetical protein